MRCYICNTDTGNINPLVDVEEDDYDLVVAHHMLIACDGPDEQFDADDNVVVCGNCIDDAINPHH
jgi:hypothetical protein